MMQYGWSGGGWGVFWMILSMSVIVALVWLAVRAFVTDGDRRDRGEPAREASDVLAERFAKGELDADEYRERRDALEEKSTLTASR
ncbi:MAG: SHOCT domain-containing protein [Actinomycetota bacterium]